jgi:hypothetical protein
MFKDLYINCKIANRDVRIIDGIYFFKRFRNFYHPKEIRKTLMSLIIGNFEKRIILDTFGSNIKQSLL